MLIVACVASEAADVELSYTVDLLHNAHGGLNRGADVLGMADLLLSSEAPLGPELRGTTAHLHLQYTHGGGFSAERVGDLQTVSNIDAPTGARIMEAWIEQSFGEQATLKAGLYDLNSEFDAIDSGGLFMGSSHGIGPDFSQSGGNGPSIFPTTSLALRGQWRSQSGIGWRSAVLDAVPGDPGDAGRTTVRLGDGVLYVLEANMERPARRAGLGVWRYSRPIPVLTAEDATTRTDYEHGMYAFVEGPLPMGSGNGVRAFARIGLANATVEQVGLYAGAGLVLNRVLFPQLENSLGIAIASARNGRAYRNLQASVGEPATSRETTVELTWQVKVNEWLVVQPDIQYVINPGTSAGVADALVPGVRLTLARAIAH